MKHLTLSFFIRFIILILLGLALTKEILTTLQSKSDATNYSLEAEARSGTCLLYTSPSPRDA